MNILSCDYRILSLGSLAVKMTKKENEDNAFHINMSLYPLKICQIMTLYLLSNTWDTKYVTVSNTWAIKDTVTSYFTKYTLCSVNTPKIYLIYILAYIVISRKKSQKPQKRIKITDFTIFTVWLLSSKSCKRGSWNRNLLNYFEKVWHI